MSERGGFRFPTINIPSMTLPTLPQMPEKFRVMAMTNMLNQDSTISVVARWIGCFFTAFMVATAFSLFVTVLALPTDKSTDTPIVYFIGTILSSYRPGPYIASWMPLSGSPLRRADPTTLLSECLYTARVHVPGCSLDDAVAYNACVRRDTRLQQCAQNLQFYTTEFAENLFLCANIVVETSDAQTKTFRRCVQPQDARIYDILQDMTSSQFLGSIHWGMVLSTSVWILASFCVYTTGYYGQMKHGKPQVPFGNMPTAFMRCGMAVTIAALVWNILGLLLLFVPTVFMPAEDRATTIPMTNQTFMLCFAFMLLAIFYFLAEIWEFFVSNHYKPVKNMTDDDYPEPNIDYHTESAAPGAPSLPADNTAGVQSGMAERMSYRGNYRPVTMMQGRPAIARTHLDYFVQMPINRMYHYHDLYMQLLIPAWCDAQVLCNGLFVVALVCACKDVVTHELVFVFFTTIYASLLYSAYMRAMMESYTNQSGYYQNQPNQFAPRAVSNNNDAGAQERPRLVRDSKDWFNSDTDRAAGTPVLVNNTPVVINGVVQMEGDSVEFFAVRILTFVAEWGRVFMVIATCMVLMGRYMAVDMMNTEANIPTAKNYAGVGLVMYLFAELLIPMLIWVIIHIYVEFNVMNWKWRGMDLLTLHEYQWIWTLFFRFLIIMIVFAGDSASSNKSNLAIRDAVDFWRVAPAI